MRKCYGCYLHLDDQIKGDYHLSCSRKLFGTETPPDVDFGVEELEDLAKRSISQHLGITGVQPKISVNIKKSSDEDPTHRMMIVGLWGDFILKPPTKRFPDMSVVEDLTMHMAEVAGIKTAKHGLIQLKSGELAYVTKRFDREKKGKKIAVEDLCQLSELLTESKYNTSYEKAGKIIKKYSSNPGLDAGFFFDLIVFSFITGNADMHLKNFSLMRTDSGEIILSPAYDLISTKLMPINDIEEMALTVNGKKAKIKKEDFISLGKNLNLSEKAIDASFSRILKKLPDLKEVISNSFLSEELKIRYSQLLNINTDKIK
jgi:serine/threonine-protein kinase HipA